MKNERARRESETLQNERGTRVEVDLDWDAPEPGVLVHEVRTTGSCADAARHLDAWHHAACYGARFAMEAVNTLPCLVHVTEVAAAPERTTATIVAAATAHAVWSALRHDPSAVIQAYVERAVEQSRRVPSDQLCPFRLH